MNNIAKKTVPLVMSVILVMTCIIAASESIYAKDKLKKPAKPKITSLVYKTKDSLTSADTEEFLNGRYAVLKWNEAKNAKKYEVWKKTGNEFKKIRTLTGTSMQYPINNAAKNRVVTFKVRGVNKTEKGNFSKERSLYVPVMVFAPGNKCTFKLGGITEKLAFPINDEHLHYSFHKYNSKTWHYIRYYYNNDKEKNKFCYYVAEDRTFMLSGRHIIADSYDCVIANNDYEIYIYPYHYYHYKNPGYIRFIPKKKGITMSYTLDGSEPVLGQEMRSGNIPAFKEEAIISGSSDKKEEIDIGYFYNEPGKYDDQFYKPKSDDNPDGYDVILDNSKTFTARRSDDQYNKKEDIVVSVKIFNDGEVIGKCACKYHAIRF